MSGLLVARRKTMTVPTAGVIKGGCLDRWRFHFLQFRVVDGVLELRALCTRPAWPFPDEVALGPDEFRQLRPIVGERARRLDAMPLIKAAYSYAGVEAPAWLSEHTGTLRACVKRSRVRPRRKAP